MSDNALSLAVNGVQEFADQRQPTFGGGGRGQTATVKGFDAKTYTGKGATKVAAAEDLLAQLRAEYNAVTGDASPKATQKRLSIEDVLLMLDKAGLTDEHTTVDTADDEGTIPGPVWKGARLVRLVPCVAECMGSVQKFCDCRCNGANHGIGWALYLRGTATAVASVQLPPTPVMMGAKLCLCGCGGTTQRRFVPGHDARYHAAQKRAAAGEGVTA